MDVIEAVIRYIKYPSRDLAELGIGNLEKMATKSSPKAATSIGFMSAVMEPVVSGVVSSTIGNTANLSSPPKPGPPPKTFASAVKASGVTGTVSSSTGITAKLGPAPKTGSPPSAIGVQGPVFPNQANPKPIEFGSGTASVVENSGRFARDNPSTKSVAGGGAGVTLSENAFPQESWRNVAILENMMRGICINAVKSMKGINFAGKPAPAVIGVLLALNEVKDGTGTARKGWQFYIHSSVRGVPLGGPKAQAVVHPVLKARIENAGIVHHFSSMCAEIGLLSNFLDDNPKILGDTGRLESCGEPIYMMTYQAGNFPLKPDETIPEDGTGYYLRPCSHLEKTCEQRRNHFGTHGCRDVLEELGVQAIGRGQPSEQDKAVLAEQTARENEAAGQVAGPSAGAQAASVTGTKTRMSVATSQGPNVSRTPAKPARG